MTKRYLTAAVLTAAMLSSINGCQRNLELPNNTSTAALYREAASGAHKHDRIAVIRPLESNPPDLRGYSRSESDALALEFPLLANPRFVLYVFPHLSNKAPVPGYVTNFSLYESDLYALPGEQ